MKVSEWARLSPTQKEAQLSDLVRQAQGTDPSQLKTVREEVALLESQYGMTTEVMKAAFKEGRVGDTYEVARWIILARMLEKSSAS